MVCPRCLTAVRRAAEATGVPVVAVRLGAVDFARPLTRAQRAAFAKTFRALEFELIGDREDVVVEELEIALRELAMATPIRLPRGLTDALRRRLDGPYDEAADLYREATGKRPSERFAELRIVRACELLREGERQASEVGYAVGYRHSSGFSRAFKRVMGVTPTAFLRGAGRPGYVSGEGG